MRRPTTSRSQDSSSLDSSCPASHESSASSLSGHAWPDFAGPAIWDFFGSLPAAVQSEKKGTGKFFSSILGQISFKVNWPDDFTGTPVKLAIALYPPGIDYTQPVLVSPTYILNPNVALGDYTFGEVYEYENITTELFGVDVPGDYVMSIVVYVAGGSYPIPTTGKDYSGYQDITLDSNTIVLETPFDLDFLDSF